MTQRLKIEGVSVILPDDADLFVNEDGEIMVQEEDGVYPVQQYMLHVLHGQHVEPRAEGLGPWG